MKLPPEFGPGDIVWFNTKMVFDIGGIGLVIARGGPHGFPGQDETIRWNLEHDDLNYQLLPEDMRFGWGWYPINTGEHPLSWGSHIGKEDLILPEPVQRYIVGAIFDIRSTK